MRRIESDFLRGLAYLGGFLLATLIVGTILGILNSNLLWGEDNQYGTVDIPSTKVIHLPSGNHEVAVALALPGRGNETPNVFLPKGLAMSLTPVGGGEKPTITRDVGSSTNANADNQDTQVRVWKIDVPNSADYRVVAKGNFTGFGVNPQLWFGYQPGFLHGANIWLAAMVVVLILAAIWFTIARIKYGGKETDVRA